MRKVLDLINIYKIPCNWSTIYVGRKIKKVTSTDLNKFATNRIMSTLNDNDKIIMELAWEKEDIVIDELLSKLIGDRYCLDEDGEQWFKELRKFRYVLLKDASETISNQELLLERIEEIYADFDYPKEMDRFIYYMPSTDGYDPLQHSKDMNIKRIVNFLCEFLEKERLEIVSS